MIPYKTKRGTMACYVKCEWANGFTQDYPVPDGYIEEFGTGPWAATAYAINGFSLSEKIRRLTVCDQSGELRLIHRADWLTR